MIYSYEVDENCEYIPVHLNVIFNSKELDFFKDLVNYKIAEDIYAKIRSMDKKYVIMDFSEIESLESRIFHVYSTLINDGFKLFFVNLNSICKGILKEDELSNYLEESCSLEGCLMSNTFDFDSQYLEFSKKEKIDNFMSTEIAKFLFENKDNRMQELESTNVKSNMYIFVKSVFLDSHIYVYLIYKICSLIKNKYDINQIDYLISSSNNGAILSTLIGQLLNKRTINFVNLGPHLSLFNKEKINELEKEKNYLLIYDFICVGTEIKLAKTIIELKDAYLIGAVGISNYLKPQLKIPIGQIFNINDKEILDFQYTIEVGETIC